jgi:hypothetical protein
LMDVTAEPLEMIGPIKGVMVSCGLRPAPRNGFDIAAH